MRQFTNALAGLFWFAVSGLIIWAGFNYGDLADAWWRVNIMPRLPDTHDLAIGWCFVIIFGLIIIGSYLRTMVRQQDEIIQLLKSVKR